jgi:hypothetical protein
MNMNPTCDCNGLTGNENLPWYCDGECHCGACDDHHKGDGFTPKRSIVYHPRLKTCNVIDELPLFYKIAKPNLGQEPFWVPRAEFTEPPEPKVKKKKLKRVNGSTTTDVRIELSVPPKEMMKLIEKSFLFVAQDAGAVGGYIYKENGLLNCVAQFYDADLSVEFLVKVQGIAGMKQPVTFATKASVN